MEQIIEELEKTLARLEQEELNDTISLAVDKSVEKTANSNSPLSLLATKMQKEKKQYDAVKKSSMSKVIATRENLIENLMAHEPRLYQLCLNEVQEAKKGRTAAIAVLKDFNEKLKGEFTKEFYEFGLIKKVLDYINLSATMQIGIFLYLVENNASLHRVLGSKVVLPNLEALLKYNYKYITREEVIDILQAKSLEEFFADKNPENPLGQMELFKVFKDTKLDLSDHQEWCQELDELFSSRMKELTDEDYEKIKNLMDNLSFGDLAYRVIKQMRRQKEISLEKDNKSPKKYNTKKTVKEPKFKARKVNQVHYEINNLYDLENFKSRTTLSLDEIIYILSLMYSIEMDKSIITRFLSSVSHEYKKNNPFAIYYQSKEKYASSDDEEVSAHLEMIEYILSDFDIFSCSDEKYTEAKSMISEELTAINQILEGNYTYEINKAKMLLKGNEGE